MLSARGLLCVLEFVVKTARKRSDELIHALIQLARLLALARNDEGRTRFIDEDGVDLVDDGKVQLALNHELQVVFEVVAQVVKSELIVGAVGDIALICGTLLLVVHAGHDDADGQPHELVDLAHPLRVAAGEVVVDRDNMHALAGERLQIGGKGCDERLTFARLHLGNASLEETDAADDLHMEVAHAEHTAARLPESREGVAENIFQRLALGEPSLEDARLRLEFLIGHRGIFGRECFDGGRRFIQFFQTSAAVAAHQITNQTHVIAPFASAPFHARGRAFLFNLTILQYFSKISKRFHAVFCNFCKVTNFSRPCHDVFGALSRRMTCFPQNM